MTLELESEELLRELGPLLKKSPYNWPPRNLSDLEYNPPHPFDKTVRPLLRWLMVRQANSKLTHWWSYKDLPDRIKLDGVLVPGDPEAFSTVQGNSLTQRINSIRMSLGGWTKGYYVFPDWDKMTKQQIQEGWRYVYTYESPHSRRSQYSNLINKYEAIVLAGPENFRIAGIEARSFKEVPVIIIPSPKGRTQSPIL